MYRIQNADEYACQITNKAGHDIAEVVRHGRRVEGDDAAGWATSRGLPLDNHTTDEQWQELLRLIDAAPALRAACLHRVMPEFDGTLKNFVDITRQLYPNCRIVYGDDDQIVIHTGAAVEMGGEVVAWEPEDQDDYQSWCDRHPEVG
jgi:hypothetical protein